MVKITRYELKVLQMLFNLRQSGLAVLLDVSEPYVTQLLKGNMPITENIERKVNERFKLNEDDELATMVKLVALRMKQLSAKGILNEDKMA